MDFRKAFDVAPHARLTKLEAYGIGGNLLGGLEIFIWEKTAIMQVVLNGCSSALSTVNSGVPRGSVLDSLLFGLYVNDIPSLVDNPILLFAGFIGLLNAGKITYSFNMMLTDLWNGLIQI